MATKKSIPSVTREVTVSTNGAKARVVVPAYTTVGTTTIINRAYHTKSTKA